MRQPSPILHWQDFHITPSQRCEALALKPSVIWLTGLSGSGKSTTANALEKALFSLGQRTFILDGDNVRHGLCRDLGFSDEDRTENVRRVAEVAKLMVDAGLLVITSFISPFAEDRARAKKLIGEEQFLEVYIKASIDTCRTRDPKKLYQQADAGEIPHFTGIDSPYEAPEVPDVLIDTEHTSIEQGITQILNAMP